MFTSSCLISGGEGGLKTDGKQTERGGGFAVRKIGVVFGVNVNFVHWPSFEVRFVENRWRLCASEHLT